MRATFLPCAFLCALLCSPSSAQDINTIVGGGAYPATPALSAYVVDPTDVVEDSQGNIYISAIDEEYILKLDTTGNVSAVAGTGYDGWGGIGGPATTAILGGPAGLALDTHNNLFIADSVGQHIWEVNATTGILTNVAGIGSPSKPLGGYGGDGGPATKAQLNSPQGVAIFNGEVAIADSANNVVRLVTLGGMISTYAGRYGLPCPDPTLPCGDGGPANQANLNYPVGVAFDALGNLYIADALDNRIRMVAQATGIISTVAGDGDTCILQNCGDGRLATKANLNYPAKVFVDKAGDLYIADENDQKIRFVNASTQKISTKAGNGSYGFSGDGGLAIDASFADPTGLFVDGAGNILIADQGGDHLREVTSDNQKIMSVAGGGSGGDGSAPLSSLFAYAYDLTVDSAGNLFIIDKDSGRIRKVDASLQTITTVAGNGTNGYSGDGGAAINATLDYPRGVALDSGGNIYIADSDNWVVRLVQNGTISTFAGNGNGCFPPTDVCGDGGPAVQANLTDPQGVAVYPAGVLFIADTSDNRIRAVNIGAQAITVAGVTIEPGDIATVAGTGDACLVAIGTRMDPCGDTGPATAARLNTPTGIALDSSGNIFIADSYDNRIRCVILVAGGCGGSKYAVGTIITYAFNGQPTFGGDGGLASDASMWQPDKVAVDAAGDLFIGGGFDNVVQRVDAVTRLIATVAGNAANPLAFGFSGDGGLATKATLSNRGIAVDGAGDMYIADNNRIRYVPHAAK